MSGQAELVATLTAGDLAVVVVTVLSVAAVFALVFSLQAVLRTLGSLGATVASLDDAATEVLAELDQLVRVTAADVARVDVILDRLEAVSSSVEGVSRVATAAVSSPVIKVLSLGSGTSAAARRLRDRKVDASRRGDGEAVATETARRKSTVGQKNTVGLESAEKRARSRKVR